MSDDTSTLNPSKLGTKEYWDNFYVVEQRNFEDNPNDTGERWFDDSDAEAKMVDFLFANLGQTETIREDSSILDLGTGNGHLLFQLAEEGFKGRLVGVDYSEVSVAFARDIAQQNDLEAVEFARGDLLDKNDSFLQSSQGIFDIILDKGTLDAIALNGDAIETGKTGTQVYPGNVKTMLKQGGILLITSCNFSEQELVKLISCDDLQVWKRIEYPSFEFGGVKGSTICSIAFIKL